MAARPIVAMLVSGAGKPTDRAVPEAAGRPQRPFDVRVRKEAETAAGLGYETHVLAYTGGGLPPPAERRGVHYLRVGVPQSGGAGLLVRLERRRVERTAAAIRAYTASRRRGGPRATALHVLQGCRLAAVHATGAPIRIFRNRYLALVARSFETRAAFRPALDELRPAIVHANDLRTLEAARAYCRRCGAALVYDAHEFELDPRPNGTRLRRVVSWALERRGIRDARCVLTVSQPIAAELERIYRIRRPYVVLNAPPFATVEGPPAFDLRAAAGAAPDDRLVVYVGNFHAARGTTLLVHAISLLPSEFRLVLVSTARPREEKILRNAARELGIDDRVHVLPPVAPAQVPATIAAADVSAIPGTAACRSYELAMPNKLFESLMAGLPIVVSRQTPAMAQFVEEHELGAVFDVTSPASIAQAIERVVDERPVGIADRALLRALQHHCSWEAQAIVLAEAYTAATASVV
jgi:glycogen(starch) synthase